MSTMQEGENASIPHTELLLKLIITEGLRTTLLANPTFEQRQESMKKEIDRAQNSMNVIRQSRNTKYNSPDDLAMEDAIGGYIPGVAAILQVSSKATGVTRISTKRQLAILFVAYNRSADFVAKRESRAIASGDREYENLARQRRMDEEQAELLRKVAGKEVVLQLINDYKERFLILRNF